MLDPDPDYRPRVSALSLNSGNSTGTIVAVILLPLLVPVVSRQKQTSSDSSLRISHNENHPAPNVEARDPISQPFARKPARLYKCSFGIVPTSFCPSSSRSVPPETIRPTRPSLSVHVWIPRPGQPARDECCGCYVFGSLVVVPLLLMGIVHSGN